MRVMSPEILEKFTNSSLYEDASSITTTSGVPPTTDAPESIPQYLGFIACGVAVLFFGSNFIPVKQFKTGDGERRGGDGAALEMLLRVRGHNNNTNLFLTINRLLLPMVVMLSHFSGRPHC